MESYRVAGIDVHKKMLAVVITAVEVGEICFERRKFAAGAADLKQMEKWLAERQVREVVMESTAQYWKPVWQQLEGRFELHLAQAHSNKAPKGRKRDFTDAERLVRRHLAGELILSFVPDEEQRLWRMITRSKKQLTRDRVRLQNQMEGFLEEIRIKLSSHVSDLLGLSARRMLHALAEGQSDPARIAELAVRGLKANPEELRDALSAAGRIGPMQRRVLKLFLDRLSLLDNQIETLEKTAAAGPAAACGCRAAAGGGAGNGCRLGAANYRGSGSDGSHVPVGGTIGFVGRLLSGKRRKRGGVHQRPVSEGQPANAAGSGAGGQRRGESKGQHI